MTEFEQTAETQSTPDQPQSILPTVEQLEAMIPVWTRPAGLRGALSKALKEERDDYMLRRSAILSLLATKPASDQELADAKALIASQRESLDWFGQSRQELVDSTTKWRRTNYANATLVMAIMAAFGQLAYMMPDSELIPTISLTDNDKLNVTFSNAYATFEFRKDSAARTIMKMAPADQTRQWIDFTLTSEGLDATQTLMLIAHLKLDNDRLPKAAENVLRREVDEKPETDLSDIFGEDEELNFVGCGSPTCPACSQKKKRSLSSFLALTSLLASGGLPENF